MAARSVGAFHPGQQFPVLNGFSRTGGDASRGPRHRGRTRSTRIGIVEWRLEVVFVPVSDVDRASVFYTDQIGFNEDFDYQFSDRVRRSS
jgi:hypothetical protein